VPTALITGASGGLGLALSKALLEDGFQLVLHYKGNVAPLIELQKQASSKVLPLQADITEEEQVSHLAEQIKKEFGKLHLLINNAGITIDRVLPMLTAEQWDQVIKVNLTGAFLVTKACLPLMDRGSLIINILSRSGLRGRRGQAAYSASKAALWGMTKSLSKELAPQGIRVNAVVPGYLPVGMGPRAPEAMKRATEESVLGSLGSVEDVVQLVKVLFYSKNITGQVFIADSRP